MEEQGGGGTANRSILLRNTFLQVGLDQTANALVRSREKLNKTEALRSVRNAVSTRTGIKEVLHERNATLVARNPSRLRVLAHHSCHQNSRKGQKLEGKKT